MTSEATTLLAAALKAVTINGSFNPATVGTKVGLNKSQAEAAARSLANDGVLSLGFDFAANFTPDYRKANAKLAKKVRGK